MRLDFIKTALIVIDVQNDFCPGGALAVPGGDKAIPPINAALEKIVQNGGKAAASQDWHPADHVSFAASHAGKNPYDTVTLPDGITQTLWPVHCVEGTGGAAFHAALATTYLDIVIRKGRKKNLDSYSAFFENDKTTPTGLHGYLSDHSIGTLVFGGLATDYCVLYSVMDALRLGYRTAVLSGAVAGVNVPEGSATAAEKTMKAAGAVFISAGELA